MKVEILGRRIYAYTYENRVLYVGFDRRNGKISKDLLVEIKEYLEGRRKEFSFSPVFSMYPKNIRKVLQYIYENVPYGSIKTYGEIAKELGFHPRFIGYALSRNKHLIIVPCHRIVSSKGIGGFSAGLDVKRFLLRLEHIDLRHSTFYIP